MAHIKKSTSPKVQSSSFYSNQPYHCHVLDAREADEDNTATGLKDLTVHGRDRCGKNYTRMGKTMRGYHGAPEKHEVEDGRLPRK